MRVEKICKAEMRKFVETCESGDVCREREGSRSDDGFKTDG